MATFDIVPWHKVLGKSALTEADFAKGDLVQYTDDVSSSAGMEKHRRLFQEADLIYVDAAHSGKQELLFWKNFKNIGLKQGCVVAFDDIRLWSMLRFWRQVDMPKLDMTSFGHFSGFGLVHWQGR